LTEFSVLIRLCVYLSDDSVLEVETFRKDISDERLLLIVQFAGSITV